MRMSWNRSETRIKGYFSKDNLRQLEGRESGGLEGVGVFATEKLSAEGSVQRLN